MDNDWFLRFLEKLGFNTTRWRWRRMQWENRMARGKADARLAKEHAVYRHKICEQCGALMDGGEKVCPRCGESAPSWSGQFLKRIFGLVLPSWGPFSFLLVFSLFAIFVIGVFQYGLGSITSPTTELLIRYGALIPNYFYDGDYWRLITYGYLHIGILHLLFNLLALTQVGPFLEKEIGSARFFSVYTLSLIGGGLADLWFRKEIFLVAGASGALFGLIGFGIAYNHFLGGPSAIARRNFFFHWAIYGFLFGIFVGADNIAHAGGLVVGAVMGFWIERESMRRRAWNPLWNILCTICVVLTILSMVGMGFAYILPSWNMLFG